MMALLLFQIKEDLIVRKLMGGGRSNGIYGT